ncbi:nuclease-related domain-containing protein [Hahella ganghwensis]|uniref:nuclease-related domain-containing protein n=1 Tax=Hahella ganghwensis TaxID=286420 RepID=UPI0003671DAE|nr:nuclease-related domain-containing protein [Hahella ganghwensis]
MDIITSSIISACLSGIPILLVGGLVYLAKRNLKNRENPLTKDLLRPPGHSVNKRLQEAQFNVITEMGVACIAFYYPPTYLGILYYFEGSVAPLVAASVIIVMSIVLIMTLAKVFKNARNVFTLKLGYECEIAVAQELDRLMLLGYRVFHDIQGDEFNIDHIVVGPNGVFAIETKGRRRPMSKEVDKRSRHKVTCYDGRLEFPSWTETEVFNQANRQAKWTSKWLSSATGNPITAMPVIVLPGWYIERKERSQVPCIAGSFNSFKALVPKLKGQTLSPSEIEAISHQIEQNCRTQDFGRARELNSTKLVTQ